MEDGYRTKNSSNEYGVVIVGSGSTGCSTGVLAARDGLDTVLHVVEPPVPVKAVTPTSSTHDVE